MSASCLDLFGKDGLVSVCVRRGRICVGTGSVKSAYCRDMFGDVGLAAIHDAEFGLLSGRLRRSRVSVGT